MRSDPVYKPAVTRRPFQQTSSCSLANRARRVPPFPLSLVEVRPALQPGSYNRITVTQKISSSLAAYKISQDPPRSTRYKQAVTDDRVSITEVLLHLVSQWETSRPTVPPLQAGRYSPTFSVDLPLLTSPWQASRPTPL